MLLRNTTQREAISVIPGPSEQLINITRRSAATDLRPTIHKFHPLKTRRIEVVY